MIRTSCPCSLAHQPSTWLAGGAEALQLKHAVLASAMRLVSTCKGQLQNRPSSCAPPLASRVTSDRQAMTQQGHTMAGDTSTSDSNVCELQDIGSAYLTPFLLWLLAGVGMASRDQAHTHKHLGSTTTSLNKRDRDCVFHTLSKHCRTSLPPWS